MFDFCQRDFFATAIGFGTYWRWRRHDAVLFVLRVSDRTVRMFWRLQHLRQKDMRRSAMLKSLLAATVIAILVGLTSASAQPGYYGQPRFYDYGQYGVHAYGGYGYGYPGYGYGYGYPLVVPRVGVYRRAYRRAYRRWWARYEHRGCPLPTGRSRRRLIFFVIVSEPCSVLVSAARRATALCESPG